MIRGLFFKIFFYVFLLSFGAEVVIRVFKLTKDYPDRIVDQYNVEKWKPNQNGTWVTGNRRQNYAEYRINSSGFNSYREFTPSYDKKEIALVGDSFIEGFHQDYYNSIGKKIENRLKDGTEVYEYGYAGYDFADQIHLVHQYKNDFEKIDYVVFGLKFNNDLTRDVYEVQHSRLKLESGVNKVLKEVKLLVYAKNIGVVNTITSFVNSLSKGDKTNLEESKITKEKEQLYTQNFKSLILTYGFDKSNYFIMIDERDTPRSFLKYLKEENFKIIYIGKSLEEAKENTTLVYDKHWNNNGRNIVASVLVKEIFN